jgi:hypothetical protein
MAEGEFEGDAESVAVNCMEQEYMNALTKYYIYKSVFEGKLSDEEFVLAEQNGFGQTLDSAYMLKDDDQKTKNYWLENSANELKNIIARIGEDDLRGILNSKYPYITFVYMENAIGFHEEPKSVLEILQKQPWLNMVSELQPSEGFEDILKP